MAWIDEVNQLVEWINDGPANNKERSVNARLVALISTGLAFYAETQGVGFESPSRLKLNGGMLSGSVKRYQTSDRWDFFKEQGLFEIPDNLPFDPTKLEDIPMSIKVTSGVIKLGNLTFPQPEPVMGRLLVSAKSNSVGFAGPWLMTLALHGYEEDEVTIN